MLARIITENGIKKIQPLTADTGTGAPVGSYLMLEKKSNPQGYLYCDGSTFDSTAYPALYQYLGSNVLPDFREFSPVGAEQNTTNVYDASTNPTGVIHDHDVYAEGESKDDQLQEHSHSAETNDTKGSSSQDVGYMFQPSGSFIKSPSNSSQSGRAGTVTRGKSRAVFIYIKATSGLTENQQENVLNTINENNSYSTTEHKTGKKWIDGKPIYSRVIITENFTPYNGNTFAVVQTDVSQLNIDRVIQISGTVRRIHADGYNSDYAINSSEASNYYSFCKWEKSASFNRLALIVYFQGGQSTKGYITLEYTKTTD